MKPVKSYLRTLPVLLALLVAGQGAWAANKTVAYRITNATNNGSSYTLTFGRADGTPFDNSSTYSSITVNTSAARRMSSASPALLPPSTSAAFPAPPSREARRTTL